MAKTVKKWIEREEKEGFEEKRDVGFVRFLGIFAKKRLKDVGMRTGTRR